MYATRFKLILAGLACLMLLACGFKLRGTGAALPWQNLYLDKVPVNSSFGLKLKRYLRARGVKIVEHVQDAEAIFHQLGDQQSKEILSFNTRGLAREYRLRRIYTMSIRDQQGRILVAPNRINLKRDVSFNDASVLAKGHEEALLRNDMENDLVEQLLHRLAAGRTVSTASTAPHKLNTAPKHKEP